MLSSILTTLQTLISPKFVVSSFIPMLAFSVLNGGMLFWLNAPFRAFVVQTMSEANATRSTFLIGACLIALAMLAYIFSALLPVIQLIMEGRWPASLIAMFVPMHVRRLELLDNQRVKNDRNRTRLTSNEGSWADRLRKARETGEGKKNSFNKETVAAKVGELEKLRRKSLAIDAETLEKAVTCVEDALENNDANEKGPDGTYALDDTQSKLNDFVKYAVKYTHSEDMRLTNELRFNFGYGASQRPAPTLMGNIANTIQNYAEQRYQLNFEVFWPSMRLAVQRDKEFGPMLQQAKIKLDFLIACSALTASWAGIWLVVSLLTGAGRLPFLTAGILGPVIAYIWYRVAAVHYRTFAALLRTSIDLFRFDLLKDLHIPLPDDLPDEQELWNTLHRVHSFYEPRSVRYQHPKPT